MFRKRVNEDLMTLRDITDDVIESDFLPYACHYDANTLLTKNGELLQTIKITGFSFESVDSLGIDLREVIRRALWDGIKTPDYAVWIHTIRRQKSLALHAEYPEPFSRYVHEQWNKRNDWEYRYTNEVYITIGRDGETGEINTAPRFFRALQLDRDVVAREERLQELHAELVEVVQRVLSILQTYGASLLGIYKRDGIYYSDLQKFVGKIFKLRDEESPIYEGDIARHMSTYNLTFGFDSMEVRSPEQVRRFGAVLTLKEYRELPLEALDRFLQLPQEFIISQCMNFIPYKQALKDFERQKEFVSAIEGPSTSFSELCGLQDLYASQTGKATDYCEHQMNIFLVADDLKQLGRCVDRAIEALNGLGFVAMRENLRMEECYWSVLPGNFYFLKRQLPINTNKIGGFANIANYPAGKVQGNYWGDAATVFNTAMNTPYFFSFHTGNIGHTTIIGPKNSGKTVLLNFLLSEARKFNNKLYFFDQHNVGEIFIRALGGGYVGFTPGRSQLPLNPFQLADTPANRDFLLLWIESLITGTSSATLSMPQEKAIADALVALMQLPQPQRILRNYAQFLSQCDPVLGRRLQPWHSGGTHASLFDHQQDMLDTRYPVIGFEMAEIVQDKQALAPTLLYLMHRLMMALDGTPAIIVLNEAWSLLDNPMFAPRLQSWLEYLAQKNALVIMATESVDDVSHSALTRNLFAHIATQIYLPNTNAGDEYKRIFGLTDTEYSYLHYMDPYERHFLLKKGNEAIVAKLSLDGMENVMNVLSATPEGLKTMHECITQYGLEPSAWLAIFSERMGG